MNLCDDDDIPCKFLVRSFFQSLQFHFTGTDLRRASRSL
jgi:hypothetical protein